MKQAQRLVAYAPNGDRIGPIPTPTQFAYSSPLGDLSALNLNYRDDVPGSALLLDPIEVAVEYSLDGLLWKEIPNGRYLRITRNNDPVGRDKVRKYTLPSYGWQLTKMRQMVTTGLNADGKRPFLSATAGMIMGLLITEAHGRGVCTGLDYDFTSTHDSDGVAWAIDLSIYYEPGLDLFTILNNLSDQGVCDWWFEGRTLRIFNPDTYLANHRDIKFFQGIDINSMPTQGSLEGIVHTGLFVGEGGATVELSNPTTPQPWGKWEGFVKQGGVSDETTMELLGAAYMEDGSEERVQFTADLNIETSKYEVWEEYAPGDYIWSLNGDGEHEEYRIRQINFTRAESGDSKITLVLNDRFIEREIRNARRTAGIVGGATSGGTGTPPTPPGDDKRIPSQVTDLLATSDVFVDPDSGDYKGVVILDWEDVTTATNGSLLEITDYEIYQRRTFPEEETFFTFATNTSDDTSNISWGPFDPGFFYEFKVRARVLPGSRVGAWSTAVAVEIQSDIIPPPIPSDPILTSRMGIIKIEWDGLDEDALSMPPDFDWVKVWRADTPDPVLIANLRAGDGRDFIVETEVETGESYSYAFSAVDRAGNESAKTSFFPIVVVSVLDETDLTDYIVEAAEDAIIASGRNRIIYSAGTPTVDGKETAGDTWFRRLVDGTVIGQWEWDGDSYEVRTLSHQVIASIDAGKITVGVLNGQIIKAGTIGAEKLVVGPAENLISDPTFQSDDINFSRGEIGNWTFDKPNARAKPVGAGSGNAMYFVARSWPSQGASVDDAIPVQAGDQYIFSFYGQASPAASVNAYVRRWGPDKTYIGVTGLGASALTATETNFAISYTVPAGTAFLLVGFEYGTLPGGVGTSYITRPFFARRNDAVTIADGAITTPKLVAGAVTADKVGAGEITGVKIAGDAIDGKTITGALIRTAATGMRIELSTSTLRIGDRPTSTTGTGFWFVGSTGFMNVLGANSGDRALMTINTATGVIQMGNGSNYVQYNDVTQDFEVRANVVTGTRVQDANTGTGWIFKASDGYANCLSDGAAFISFNAATKSINMDDGTIYLGDNGSLRSGTVGQRLHILPDGILRSWRASGTNPFFEIAPTENRVRTRGVQEAWYLDIMDNVVDNQRARLDADGDGDLRIYSSLGGIKLGPVSGSGVKVINTYSLNPPGTDTVRVLQIRNDGLLMTLESSETAKLDIENYEFNLDGYLALEPKSWVWRSSVEKYADNLHRMVNGEELSEKDISESYGALNRHHGLIAERMVEAGLTEFVSYNEDGTPHSINYDRAWIPLIPIVRKLVDRVAELESIVHNNA